jgi:hypothetical protein
MSRKGIPEKVGMLISGLKTDSVYRRYNIIDMEVVKTATTKIEEHQREIVKTEISRRTAAEQPQLAPKVVHMTKPIQ